VAAGAVLDVGGSQVTIGSLSDAGGSGGIVKNGDTLATGLTTGTDNTSTSFSGTIEDGAHVLSLTKVGTDTFTLAGANTYSGGTSVNGGTLRVDGSIIGGVTVNAGGTLGGNGTTGNVTVENGGTLSPGDSPGILHTGNVVFAGGAHFATELGGSNPGVGGYDHLAANGTVDLGGATLDLSFVNGFHPVTGETFDIVSSSDRISGTFAGLAEGKKFSADGVTWAISYHGGSGDDVVLTAVLAGVRIVISKPGHHLINATHTVRGQPLPTNYGDIIICRRGNNVVHAGAGPDTIVVGSGHDHLFGGGGDNTFVFRSLNTDAHIGDFNPTADKLEFAKSVFKSAGHIDYDAATGVLSFDPENVWQQPVEFATLAPHLHLHHDFLFV
jgi:autotransporter-associated beta strand protein